MDWNDTLATPLRVAPAKPVPGDDSKLLLGRYRLLARLGAGGFGVVWRAHDQQLDREVAVKRIPLPPGEGAPGHADAQRAAREATATARLSHPAIVALYEAHAEEDAFYLISELVHGDTLAELIETAALCDEEIVEIGLALGGALEHAHERGVIHRDVKPRNVLVPRDPGERDEPAKLTDFGGAFMVGEEALTRTGDVLGTLAYMAPEQCDGGEVDERADLYSLGLVLYEALSGVNPVRGATAAATARRIGQRLPPLDRSRPDLGPAVTAAIDLALEPDPRLRGTLGELREALEDALAGGLVPRRPPIIRRRPRVVAADPVERAQTELLERASTPAPAVAATTTGRLGRTACAVPAGLLIAAACAWLGPAPPLPAGLAGALAALLVAALPRLGWLLAAIALVSWQLLAARAGVALLLACAALPVAPLLRRAGPEWSAAVLAPVLGLAGLAGAFPALAGQAPRWRARAALAALGYWWLVLAEPLLARRLWLGRVPGTPARALWEGSLTQAAVHVVGPLLTLGTVLGAALWAVAALALPWIVRGRNSALDFLAATIWSAALIAAAPPLDAGLSGALDPVAPHGAAAGAILGGLLAVGARALRGPV